MSCQHYENCGWADLTGLWHAYNRHLAHVIGQIPEARRDVPCKIGANAPVSLGFLAHDYVVHLKHHLAQVTTSECVASLIWNPHRGEYHRSDEDDSTSAYRRRIHSDYGHSACRTGPERLDGARRSQHQRRGSRCGRGRQVHRRREPASTPSRRRPPSSGTRRTRATGNYTLKGTFTLVKPSDHTNYYGLVFGGSDLEGPKQTYLYFTGRRRMAAGSSSSESAMSRRTTWREAQRGGQEARRRRERPPTRSRCGWWPTRSTMPSTARSCIRRPKPERPRRPTGSTGSVESRLEVTVDGLALTK